MTILKGYKKAHDSYELLYAPTVSDLKKTIESLARGGWVVHGSPIKDDSGFYQAMVRPEIHHHKQE